MPRYAKKIDANQPNIVNALRSIPGVTVELDHDDIIVGFQGRSYWYEIKDPDAVGKNGEVKRSELKPSQRRILKEYAGHYKVVWDVGQILRDIGITGS